MKTLAAVTVFFGLAAGVGASTQQVAPSATDGPTFDVASIRRNDTPSQGGGLSAPQPGGRYIALGVTLRRLVGDAYDQEVVGGPSWADSDRFDVNARADGNPNPGQIRQMLRPLLADRFKLAFHIETSERPIFNLVMARSDRRPGERLKESDATCAEEARNFFPSATGAAAPMCGDFRLGARQLTARGMTMESLARLLRGTVGRPVVDRTGLGGAFDLQLSWTTDGGLAPSPRDAAGARELVPDGLSLFTALQEQLGLRLEPTRGPVGTLVIDSAEPPTPN